MNLPIKTESMQFDTGISGVSGCFYRLGSNMIIKTWANMGIDTTRLEVVPYGYKVEKEVAKHYRFSDIGHLQEIVLDRAVKIEGWASEVIIASDDAAPYRTVKSGVYIIDGLRYTLNEDESYVLIVEGGLVGLRDSRGNIITGGEEDEKV